MANQNPLVGAIILVGAIADIFIFSSMKADILILLIVGSILAFIGFFTKYRIASIGGLALLGAGIAASMEVESLLEIRMILTAVLGIFLPLYLIGIVTLSTREEKRTTRLKSKRHLYIFIAFIGICILSIPIGAVILQIIFPTISLQLSTLIEIALMLAVTTIATVILTFYGIHENPHPKQEEEEIVES